MSYYCNKDCFNEFPNIATHSVDLVVVDVPYGQIRCVWDVKLDLVKMWEQLKRIGKNGCIYIFFTTTKYGYELIRSNPEYFRYDIVWEKSNTVGFLGSKKMPLRAHEMIYVFARNSRVDIDNSRNIELREYAKEIKTYINKSKKEINKVIGNQGLDHFFSFATTQFGLPSETNYNRLITHYQINDMIGFKTFEELKATWKTNTYNPQKTKGKPYKTVGAKKKACVYGNLPNPPRINNTGDRYPTSILHIPEEPPEEPVEEPTKKKTRIVRVKKNNDTKIPTDTPTIVKFNNPAKSLHPTQKPTALCEWLIRTYSNENDMVLDFCMGSGSTIEACINTNRRYIGIEMNKENYDVADKRLKEIIEIKNNNTL